MVEFRNLNDQLIETRKIQGANVRSAIFFVLLGTIFTTFIAAQAYAAGKKEFLQGDSVEFLYLNKIKSEDANALLWSASSQAYIKITDCSNVIAEIVSNDQAPVTIPAAEPIPAYYVKVRRPRVDTMTFISFGDYACFDNSGKDRAKLMEIDDKSKLYLLSKKQIELIPHIDVGATYGMMIIPFKQYIGGGALKDGGTVGAYAGYKQFFADHAISLTPIFALGYSNQKYDAIDPATSKVKEYSAGMLSAAVGLIWGLSYDRFNMGVLYGVDNRNSADTASPSFNGQWWSIMFGVGLDSSSQVAKP